MDGIVKTEETTADTYTGTKDALIAAGLARANQFPPDGKAGISYCDGVAQKRRGNLDEIYLRVERTSALWREQVGCPEGMWRVRIGVSLETVRQRKKQEQQDRLARQAAELKAASDKSNAEDAEIARYRLNTLPLTVDEFRRKKARQLRDLLRMNIEPFGRTHHGFEFTTAGIESVLIACDAVLEAVMAAEVRFDQEIQQAKVSEMQAQIAAVEPAVASKIAALARPNPGILEGGSA